MLDLLQSGAHPLIEFMRFTDAGCVTKNRGVCSIHMNTYIDVVD